MDFNQLNKKVPVEEMTAVGKALHRQKEEDSRAPTEERKGQDRHTSRSLVAQVRPLEAVIENGKNAIQPGEDFTRRRHHQRPVSRSDGRAKPHSALEEAIRDGVKRFFPDTYSLHDYDVRYGQAIKFPHVV